MKAAELAAREPLAETLSTTFARFLTLRFGGAWQVTPEAGEKGQRWYCNQQINAIFTADAEPPVFEVVRREFSRSTVAWRRPLQQLYVALATHRPFSRLLAAPAFTVNPPVPSAGDWLIIPGSHKVRFLNATGASMYCVRKSCSSPQQFAQEAAARLRAQAAGIRVPAIVERPSEDCLVEQVVLGTPVNRLGDAAVRERATRMALAELGKLQDATAEQTTVDDYARPLVTGVLSDVSTNAKFAEPAATWRAAAQALGSALQRHSAEPLVTVMSHGDFQPANLLWDGGHTWLIDWEYSERNQQAYDETVLRLASRFPAGLALRVAEDASAGTPSTRLLLFLLEEMRYHLRENAHKQWPKLTQASVTFTSELPAAVEAAVQAR